MEITTKKMIKKWLKNAKAVSPIIATLLMIVISVVAGVMIYGWISGFIQTGVPSAPSAYIITINSVTASDSQATEAYATNNTILKVKIQNPGAKDIEGVISEKLGTVWVGTTHVTWSGTSLTTASGVNEYNIILMVNQKVV